MKYTNKLVGNLTMLASLLSIGSVHAQGREIQDSLIYTDPTVSQSSNYIYGGSLEYWSTKRSMSNSYIASNKTLSQVGMNFFVGKDNLTAAISYRGNGSSTVNDINYYDNSVKDQDGTFSELEFTVRLLSKEGYINKTVFPYLIGGYTLGRSTYYPNGTAGGTTNYSSPILGFGSIIPFNEKVGIRVDAKGYSVSQNAGSTYGTNSNQTSGGNIVTLNLYWNLDKEWNAQVGARKIEYAGSSNLAFAQRGSGYFVMLGKTFR